MVFSYYTNSTPYGKTLSISHNILHEAIQKYIIDNDVYQPYYLVRDSGIVLSIYLYCGDRIDVNYEQTTNNEETSNIAAIIVTEHIQPKTVQHG